MSGGNLYDKYGTRNPVARWLMNRFLSTVKGLLPRDLDGASTILEVGCGEGRLLSEVRGFYPSPPRCFGCDVDEAVIRQAQADYDDVNFSVASIYTLPYDRLPVDLVLCCEVCEHLEEPHKALQCLRNLKARTYILSVPQEPIWRMLNVVRLSYLREWGNTPGHIQHWSRREFVDLVTSVFTVETVHSPTPWTIVRARL